jgi:1,2-diacylglycerol 3-beta-glucosyltransferase
MLFLFISIVIYISLSYTAALFVLSRRRRPAAMPAPTGLFYVFLIPCLNEQLVIGQSLERLLSLEGEFAVVVIDDGSDDATAEVVRNHGDSRVWLYRRELPNARLGKGAALNAGFQYIQTSGVTEGRRPEDVVVAVVDADGRVAPNALFEVAPHFRDPRVGAVQIGVRMYNADAGVVSRMQDLEFVTYTEIFQRARQRLGSVGLGGNGQFVRLAALAFLGDEPWTDCLTEDLDLGIRLLAAGWSNAFCPTTHVSQQAVTSLRRLVRQRTRWFQGHLQCWRRIPLILRSQMAPRSRFDLVQHLLSPVLLLATSLMVPSLALSLGLLIVFAPMALFHALAAHWGLDIFFWYLLTFGLAHFYGLAYWMQEESLPFARALAYAHIYTIYGYFWFVAGWRAVFRIVTRRSAWSKTARTVEAGLARTIEAELSLTIEAVPGVPLSEPEPEALVAVP